jgi:hypothetical protein
MRDPRAAIAPGRARSGSVASRRHVEDRPSLCRRPSASHVVSVEVPHVRQIDHPSARDRRSRRGNAAARSRDRCVPGTVSCVQGTRHARQPAPASGLVRSAARRWMRRRSAALTGRRTVRPVPARSRKGKSVPVATERRSAGTAPPCRRRSGARHPPTARGPDRPSLALPAVPARWPRRSAPACSSAASPGGWRSRSAATGSLRSGGAVAPGSASRRRHGGTVSALRGAGAAAASSRSHAAGTSLVREMLARKGSARFPLVWKPL